MTPLLSMTALTRGKAFEYLHHPTSSSLRPLPDEVREVSVELFELLAEVLFGQRHRHVLQTTSRLKRGQVDEVLGDGLLERQAMGFKLT